MPCDPDQKHTINLKTWEIELIVSALESERNYLSRMLFGPQGKEIKDGYRKQMREYEQIISDLMNVLDQSCLDKKDNT